jgi:hypothetical protein
MAPVALIVPTLMLGVPVSPLALVALVALPFNVPEKVVAVTVCPTALIPPLAVKSPVTVKAPLSVSPPVPTVKLENVALDAHTLDVHTLLKL